MKNLRNYIRNMILAEIMSHSDQPNIGDRVVNTNPGCKHYGSAGIVTGIGQLPDSVGSTVIYKCTNSGPTWVAGDVLEKTMDQVDKLQNLNEQVEMLDIVTNPYEDVEDINILANYAHRNDMQGALKDPTLKHYIDKNEAMYLVDDSYGWLKHVGKEDQGEPPAPSGWDLNKVYDFVQRFEDEASKVFSQKDAADHASAPNKIEREIIGNAFTYSYVMPDEIKGLEFQIRRRGGKPSNINIEDDSMVSNIRAEDAERKGLTLDDIIKVLRDNGAKERKKRAPIRHTPPMYD